MKTDISKPWYREFWAWFILSPLILVVIVSSFTVTVAFRYADDRVLDNYYKEGRMINMRLDQDLLARDLQVEAIIYFDTQIGELVLTLNLEDADYPEQLRLEMSHPAEASEDHYLTLTRLAKNQYSTELFRADYRYRWYLRLLPAMVEKNKTSWRLRGEIDFSRSNSVTLTPDD
ncbi:MAG: hypothetical protein ACJA04_000388 [Cellvibrionaceae bacterium]|jgi:hypothetical protein